MSKIKYDVSDVEDNDFDTIIPPDVYKARIDSVTEKVSKSGNDMLEIVYKITHGDFKGRQIWDYVVLAASSGWKMKQLVKALGLKDAGTLDTKRDLEGKAIQIRTKTEGSEDSEYGIQARIQRVIPAKGAAAAEEEVEEVEEEVGEEVEEGDGEAFTWEDLLEYDKEDLKSLIEEEELDIKAGRKNVDKLRQEVADELGIEASEEEEEEDEDEEAVDYSELSIPELKAELKERGLPAKGPKAKLIAALEADDEDSDADPF